MVNLKPKPWPMLGVLQKLLEAAQRGVKADYPAQRFSGCLESLDYSPSELRCLPAEQNILYSVVAIDGRPLQRNPERGAQPTWERSPLVQTQNAAAVFLFTTAIYIASISSLEAAIGDRLDRSHLVQTFDEEFSSPVSFYSALAGKGTWKTSFYWGAQNFYTSREENDTANIFSDQAYNGVNPFIQGNGLMAITAVVDANPSNPNNHNFPYTSGLLTTEKSFAQTYGYFEAKAALPIGQGLWPAFWMLSGSQGAAEEIDVMESLGQDSNTIYSSVHYLTATPPIGKTFTTTIDNAARMHTYGVLWTVTQLAFYVDDINVASYANPGFRDPMYMLLCLQVGAAGSWPGLPNATTTFPSQMLIDYIRAYSIKP